MEIKPDDTKFYGNCHFCQAVVDTYANPGLKLVTMQRVFVICNECIMKAFERVFNVDNSIGIMDNSNATNS